MTNVIPLRFPQPKVPPVVVPWPHPPVSREATRAKAERLLENWAAEFSDLGKTDLIDMLTTQMIAIENTHGIPE
jgi:hypothetical protein